MLTRTPFYYSTLRNATIAFGNLFNEIYIESEEKVIQVPLMYLPKEKFVQRVNARPELNGPDVKVETTLPAMGFEMTDVAYDAERKLNKLNTLKHEDKKMLNRTPYLADFVLYVGVRKMDEGFRILEQILPYFTPELIVKIKDKPDYDIQSNIPITLQQTSYEVIADGDFEDRRSILWTLNFSAKIYMYPDTKSSGVIRRTNVDVSLLDTSKTIETLIQELNPFEAAPDDSYVIDEQWYFAGDEPNNINIHTRPDSLIFKERTAK